MYSQTIWIVAEARFSEAYCFACLSITISGINAFYLSALFLAFECANKLGHVSTSVLMPDNFVLTLYSKLKVNLQWLNY